MAVVDTRTEMNVSLFTLITFEAKKKYFLEIKKLSHQLIVFFQRVTNSRDHALQFKRDLGKLLCNTIFISCDNDNK